MKTDASVADDFMYADEMPEVLDTRASCATTIATPKGLTPRRMWKRSKGLNGGGLLDSAPPEIVLAFTRQLQARCFSCLQ